MCHDVIEMSYSMCHITADVPIIIHKHFIVTEYGCLWHHKPQDMSVGVVPTASQHGMGTLNLQHDRFYLCGFWKSYCILGHFGPMFARTWCNHVSQFSLVGPTNHSSKPTDSHRHALRGRGRRSEGADMVRPIDWIKGW